MSYYSLSRFRTIGRMLLLLILAFLLLSQKAAAQSDEAAIRQLVADHNAGKDVIRYTDNRVFVSGPHPRPSYSKDDAMYRQVSDSLARVRSNMQQEVEIKRLEVSSGGDMAYEVGEGRLQFTAANKREEVRNAYVRIWRKINGEWLVDVFFARPNRP